VTQFTINISGTSAFQVTTLRDGSEIARSKPFKRRQKAAIFANRQSKSLARWNPKATIIINDHTQGPF